MTMSFEQLKMETPQTLWTTWFGMTILAAKKCFLMTKQLPLFQFVPGSLWTYHRVPIRSSALLSLLPLARFGQICPKTRFHQTEKLHLSQTLLILQMLHSLHHLHGISLAHSGYSGTPRAGPCSPNVSYSVRAGVNKYLLHHLSRYSSGAEHSTNHSFK